MKEVYPRHFLLKCLYQVDIVSCCIYVVGGIDVASLDNFSIGFFLFHCVN
jgi:hypothetical protein